MLDCVSLAIMMAIILLLNCFRVFVQLGFTDSDVDPYSLCTFGNDLHETHTSNRFKL